MYVGLASIFNSTLSKIRTHMYANKRSIKMTLSTCVVGKLLRKLWVKTVLKNIHAYLTMIPFFKLHHHFLASYIKSANQKLESYFINLSVYWPVWGKLLRDQVHMFTCSHILYGLYDCMDCTIPNLYGLSTENLCTDSHPHFSLFTNRSVPYVCSCIVIIRQNSNPKISVGFQADFNFHYCYTDLFIRRNKVQES